MFDAGFSELILLFAIGLLILGPERLPRVASQVGRWVSKARRTASQLRRQLEREMALNDIREKAKQQPPKPRPSAGSDAADGEATEADASPAEAPADGSATANAATAGADTSQAAADTSPGAATADPAPGGTGESTRQPAADT